MVGIMQGHLNNEVSTSSLDSEGSSPARAPLKKVLTKSNSYMQTGSLEYDVAVVSYMQKLDEHRKRCEAEGRYQEARAALTRLADLKTAQVGAGLLQATGIRTHILKQRNSTINSHIL